jgi:hypothetical protein
LCGRVEGGTLCNLHRQMEKNELMPTGDVNLTDRLEGESEAKLSSLRAAIDEGDASGVMDCDPFERIRAAIRVAPKSA